MFISFLTRRAQVRRQASLSVVRVSVPPYERKLGLDVRLIPLGHACLSPSLREGLRLDVRLVSVSCAFLPSLREEIRLEFRLVSVMRVSLPFYERGLG